LIQSHLGASPLDTSFTCDINDAIDAVAVVASKRSTCDAGTDDCGHRLSMSECISLCRPINNPVDDAPDHSVGFCPSHRQPVGIHTVLGDYVSKLLELEPA
jgi:hypothetical protein